MNEKIYISRVSILNDCIELRVAVTKISFWRNVIYDSFITLIYAGLGEGLSAFRENSQKWRDFWNSEEESVFLSGSEADQLSENLFYQISQK